MTRRSLVRGALGSLAFLLLGWPRRDGATESAPSSGIGGTALGSGPHPAAPPAPLTGLTVVLLPRSDALLGDVERVRRHSRDSLAAYRSAIPELRRMVEGAVAALRAEGQGATVRNAAVDAGGRFALPDVSPGQWILIGYRSVRVDRARHDTMKESGTFLAQPRLIGYDRVSMWLQTPSVEPGRAAVVELTDRNVWFEGVEERRAARESVPVTGNQRSAR